MLYIVQNDEDVPPGNLLESLPEPYRLLHPCRGETLPDPAAVTALIVLGGAMGANDEERFPFLADVKALIRAVVDRGIPYLGVCLGGQLLAAALGARVVSNRWQELGALPVSLTDEGARDRLFEGVSARFATFQWHHDSFDLPEAGVLLASSGRCPHQAFRVGASAWGLQFHPEVTEEIARNWAESEPLAPQVTAAILATFSEVQPDYTRISRRLTGNFLAIAGLHEGIPSCTS
jgi:GMP synthase-like glutamine amidotransferase